MDESAIQQAAPGASRLSKRALTAHRITTTAQQLVLEHGLDGFTMEQLAERVGVSRRTLFNYFPGKDDAVLGGPPSVDEDLLGTFRAGGPTGTSSTTSRRSCSRSCATAPRRGRTPRAAVR